MGNKILLKEVKEKTRNAKAFLFDFDGTLVNLDKLTVDSFAIVFKQMFNLDFTRDDFMKYISGRGSRNGIVEYLEINGVKEFSSEELNTLFYENKERLISERLNNEIYLLPGIKEFLKHFEKDKKRVMVVTSSRKDNVQQLLTHFDIYKYFEKVFDRTMVVRGKPDPETYLNAIEYTGLDANECIAFEDSFYGLQAAKGSELFTIGIHNPGWNDDFVNQLADYVIIDYREII